MKTRFDKIYLEITNACNLSCSFCGLTRRTEAFMTEERFALALDRLEGYAPVLYFHLMGEPLLHPLLPVFLDRAGERGFSVRLTTNATLLPARLSDLSGKKGLERVNLSVQSMERVPEGERLTLMRELSDSVRALVASQRAVRPSFLASFRLWTRDDADFTLPLLDFLAREFRAEGTPELVRGRNGYPLAPGIAIHAADTFDWPRSPPLYAEAGAGFCRGLRDQIGVLADGTVVPCCLDRNGDIALGNLFDSPLDAILSAPRAKALYDGFTARRTVEPLCAGCTYRERFTARGKR